MGGNAHASCGEGAAYKNTLQAFFPVSVCLGAILGMASFLLLRELYCFFIEFHQVFGAAKVNIITASQVMISLTVKQYIRPSR